MTGPAVVRVGPDTVRVAGVGPSGAVRVVESAADPSVPLPVLLAGLVDGAGPVVPLGDPAVALAGGADVLVIEARGAATALALVLRGRVVARRSGPGGAELDRAVAALLVRLRPAWAGRPELVAEAHRVREALSLLPFADATLPGTRPVRVEADAVRAVLAAPLGEVVRAAGELGGGVPVLVTGGLARTPLLAELLDAAGLPDVRVADRPDVAALLAALDHLRGRDRPRHDPRQPDRPQHHDSPSAAPRPSLAAGRSGPGPPSAGAPWLPPVPLAHRWRRIATALAAAVLLGALHLAGAAVGRATAGPDEVPPGLLVQYDYQLRVPDGWAHTGGLPERRRTLLTPLTAPAGSDLIAVESTPLGYDAGAEPQRAAAELRAEYDAAVAAGSRLAGYDPAAEFGGRAVTAYREDAGATAVRWFVVLDGPVQRSVGCRHTPAGAAAVLAACAAVVASLGPL